MIHRRFHFERCRLGADELGCETMGKPILQVSEVLLPGSEARLPVPAHLRVGERILLHRQNDPFAVDAEILAGGLVRGLERRTLDDQPVVEHGFGPDADALVLTLRLLLPQIDEKDAGRFADRAAAALPAVDRGAVLATLDVRARLSLIQKAAQRNADADRALTRVEILREKKREIMEELGLEDKEEIDQELRARIDKLPPEPREAARKQAARLANLGDGPEQSVARTYLEWLLELPWSERTADTTDVPSARAILDADHHGLQKIKKRVLEYLAVRRLAPSKKGPILCFYGPPGVGKTSLGRSIARALGREFMRVSLGGVRDEAEIRGHRRTYVGALPGRIIQAMRKVGVKNPVIMLDEIDKLTADFRGDPSAALLEVLDPEQNGTFSDHYIEVPFDLSEVVFIATANDLGTIPAPLLDRMEVLTLPGYSIDEKREIARKHLVPKQLREHGLAEGAIDLSDLALEEIIGGYTRESGVRNLEREIANILRGVAVRVASGDAISATLGPAEIEAALGPRRFVSETAESTLEPGVATGMAWTPTGGEILFVEATRMPGRGQLVLTGQLGEVMRESATAAFSWVRSNAARLGIDSFEKSDVHVHVPGGAVPKDGPSAGVALSTALVSLLTGRPLRGDVAMTGEITLRGLVLPVGGVAQKVLAAHRAGIKTVLLPERNVKDLDELPAATRAQLEVIPLRRIDDVLAVAFGEGQRADEWPVLAGRIHQEPSIQANGELAAAGVG
jgi:ATP-dependent Lon protease